MATADIKKLFCSVVLFAAIVLQTGCGLSDENKAYERIRFDGRDYVMCGNTVLLNYRAPGISSWEDELEMYLTKIGKANRTDVYAIAGLDRGAWIYVNNDSMLASSPNGVYHASEMTFDTVNDFKPDGLAVYSLTKPTANGSGTEELHSSTADKAVIDSVVQSILNGEALTRNVLEELILKDWKYKYRLEFQSSSYPSLIYLYEYTIFEDGKCYVFSDQAGYVVKENLMDLLDAKL